MQNNLKCYSDSRLTYLRVDSFIINKISIYRI